MEKPDHQQDLRAAIQELSIAYEELSLLYRVAGIFSSLSIDDICDRMIDEAIDTIGVTTAAVLFHDEKNDLLYSKTFRGRWDTNRSFGLRSLLEVLPSGDFPRLKLGIGRPTGKDDVVEHVLSPFGPDEGPLVEPLLARAADAAEAVVRRGTQQAMNAFNG